MQPSRNCAISDRPDSPASTEVVESRVFVASLSAETALDAEPEIPWEITPAPGAIALQLRTTVRRISMGAGLARRSELVQKVRGLPEVPALAISPVAGTFIIGGEGWLGLCAIGVPPAGTVFPLDWMVENLHRWFNLALQPWGIKTECGRIEGAWCPGFSDLGVAGKKLIGQGFRVTREHVIMRGTLAVQPLTASDLAALQACHALIGLDVRASACTSVSEATAQPQLSSEQLMRLWREVELAQH